jgi:hypothetical protein
VIPEFSLERDHDADRHRLAKLTAAIRAVTPVS